MSIEIDNFSTTSSLDTETFYTPTLSPVESKTNSVAKAILDPTIATIHLGIQFEKTSTAKLENIETKANQTMESIELLLDLSQELASVQDANPVFSGKALEILKKLEDKGVSVVDTTGKVSKEELIAVKSNLSLRIDKMRTEVQQLFTKIQTLVQYMSSVNDTVKKMIADNSDFLRKVSERCLKR